MPEPSLANDFSHPICAIAGEDSVSDISAKLPPIQKTGELTSQSRWRMGFVRRCCLAPFESNAVQGTAGGRGDYC